MTQKQAIQLFEERKVRTVWDDQTEEWYFSIVDVVGVLTDSVNPTDYIKKMKKRDPELSKGWGQIVTPLSVQTAGGRQRVNCATTQGMFRIIQSIPSPKAEPFKQWMAQVVGLVDCPKVGLDLPLDIRGTAFQQRVWQALREIPPGVTTSYGELAQRIGAPRAVRAVAGACAANALAVAIPCHRVVRHDGSVSGYRWGVARKHALLAREAQQKEAPDD